MFCGLPQRSTSRHPSLPQTNLPPLLPPQLREREAPQRSSCTNRTARGSHWPVSASLWHGAHSACLQICSNTHELRSQGCKHKQLPRVQTYLRQGLLRNTCQNKLRHSGGNMPWNVCRECVCVCVCGCVCVCASLYMCMCVWCVCGVVPPMLMWLSLIAACVSVGLCSNVCVSCHMHSSSCDAHPIRNQ